MPKTVEMVAEGHNENLSQFMHIFCFVLNKYSHNTNILLAGNYFIWQYK